MKTTEIIQFLNARYPLALQESYDNSGLILDFKNEVSSILIAFDITLDTINEAILNNVNLIISHHPAIFGGIKKLSIAKNTDQIIIKAIQHEISIIALHTNIDNSIDGVNGMIAHQLGLQNIKILRPSKGQLVKFTTYVPQDYEGVVRDALFESGAGTIGAYSDCSFNTPGEGTFKASASCTPFVGEINELHFEPETKIETILPEYLLSEALKRVKSVHPYEEVAYDIYPLMNVNPQAGSGILGELGTPLNTPDFLLLLKNHFNLKLIRHSKLITDKIKTIAFCGGSGSFLIPDAIRHRADIFITGDLKYHDFFEADNKIILADIGHFESEQHTIDILYDVLMKKFPNFAILKTKINSNPVELYI